MSTLGAVLAQPRTEAEAYKEVSKLLWFRVRSQNLPILIVESVKCSETLPTI